MLSQAPIESYAGVSTESLKRPEHGREMLERGPKRIEEATSIPIRFRYPIFERPCRSWNIGAGRIHDIFESNFGRPSGTRFRVRVRIRVLRPNLSQVGEKIIAIAPILTVLQQFRGTPRSPYSPFGWGALIGLVMRSPLPFLQLLALAILKFWKFEILKFWNFKILKIWNFELRHVSCWKFFGMCARAQLEYIYI